MGAPVTTSIRITRVTITPVAFADPPLLNSVGVHEPFALRAIIEIATDAGLTGLGETYADEKHLAALHAAAAAIEGVDIYHTEEIYRRVQAIAVPETTISLSLIHISEPTRLGMISYAVFCLKKKNNKSKLNKTHELIKKKKKTINKKNT